VNGRLPGETRPAGFWIRVVASLVDFVVIGIVQFSLEVTGSRLWGAGADQAPAFQVSVGLFTLLFAALYTTVLHAADGRTIGKLLVGARVIGVEGERLTAGAALLRWFGYFLSAIPLGFGFVMAGLRGDKRALHDLIAGSRVERTAVRRRWRPAAPSAPPPPPRVTSPEPV